METIPAFSESQCSFMPQGLPVNVKQKDLRLPVISEVPNIEKIYSNRYGYKADRENRPLSSFILGTELPDYFFDSSEDDTDSVITTPLTPATPYDYFADDQKGIEECISEDGVDYTASDATGEAMTSLAGVVSPTSVFSFNQQKQLQNPIEKVQQDMQAFEGGDQVFMMSMGFLLSKLLIAMDDPHSAYLFRDFAGTFTEFLDRFGPCAYDCQRAPKSISWMIKLVLPWLQMNHPEFEVQFSVFYEVSGWARNMIKLLGASHSTAILEEGLWESCCDQMAHSSPHISKIAYQTAKQIITSVPLERNIISKIFLMRNFTLGYDDIEMFLFRRHRTNLLNHILERIDNTLYPSKLNEYQGFVCEIEADLVHSINMETDANVKQCISECLDYAKELLQSFQALESNSPVQIMASNVTDHKHRPSRFLCQDEASPIDAYLNQMAQGPESTTTTYVNTYTSAGNIALNRDCAEPKQSRRHRIWEKISNKLYRFFHKCETSYDITMPIASTVISQPACASDRRYDFTGNRTDYGGNLRPFNHRQDVLIPHANEIESYFLKSDI